MRRFSNRRKFTGLAAVLVLAGCAGTGGTSAPTKSASVPAATSVPATASAAGSGPVIESSSDQGTIVFFRESKFVGGGMSFKVREGDQELGLLKNGTYFVAKLPPGPHEFVVHSEAKDILNMEVEAGETYYVQGSLSFGVVVGRPNLSPSDVKTFDGVKAKLKDSKKK